MTNGNAKKPRRARADSKEEAVRTMIAAATRNILPPDDVTYDKTDLVLFNEIIAEFATVDWTPHTVRVAWFLARTMHEMQDDLEELRSEGSVIENARGTPVMNPRRTACQGYAGQINQFRRTLALHATAGSSKEDTATRRGHHKAQENDNPLDDDDDALLAVPTHGTA